MLFFDNISALLAFSWSNSALLALSPIKILLFFHRYIPPWLCFSFKNSFLVFVFILKVLFHSLLFHFNFSFSLIALPIQFYQTMFRKSMNVTNLGMWMIFFFHCTNTLSCSEIVLLPLLSSNLWSAWELSIFKNWKRLYYI